MLDQAPGAIAETASIAVGHLTHAFRRSAGEPVVALRDVSFGQGPREFISVVGTSGCGKSTLLRIIAGLVPPSAGQVSVLGDVAGARRGEVSLVFQRPVLLQWLDVLGNVLFPLRHMRRRVGAAETERAMDLLAMMGIADFARNQPKELSGGMQQRVGICRALITDPRLLLMDEPFAALDALTREELGFELLRLCTEQPKAVLFVTHSISEAVLLSDRILVMSPRPGTLRCDYAVPLPRPRRAGVMREPIFQEICGHVRDAVG